MKRKPFRLEWTAQVHEYKERGSEWFWAVWIIAVSLAVTAVIFSEIILGLLILVGTFSLSLFINREPETIDVVIDEWGVTKGKIHYPYETLASFHIDIMHSHPKIMIRSHTFFLPLITVPLHRDLDEEEVHAALTQFLDEEPHTLPFVETLLEYLGF